MNHTSLLLKAVSVIRTQTPTGTPERILDAGLRQFEIVGITRSRIEDIARRARLARVTLYRYFPSKERIVEAVILRELGRFLVELEAEVSGHRDLEDKIVEGFVFTLTAVRGHALLNRLLETEPESLLPFLTTEGGGLVETASNFLADQLAQEVHDDRTDAELRVVSELTVRVILSFVLTPSISISLDTPEGARRFARRHLLPRLRDEPAG
ncbi:MULTISPECIES: TetR/AcrR family transcriptional regulator [Nocardia]|uniref:HTH-type transcriptional regulator RutR n=1 Tax=Nocardia africana TaxID=134964 RepID=A0A378X5B1_9NOCA|nr:TetR/AcrR family transcriptional regulator [Nocardia africana]MCC3317835.1 TetR/AcrR family transcriptional regulator [Nocardia africana]SUA48608.1 HTH-type transcriptional regulator RutR [Nocardia africana]